MVRRKGGADLAPMSTPRRAVELFKDILIVALTCSSVLLAAQTPIFNQVRGWITPPTQTTPAPAQQSGDAVVPYAICTQNSLGLYGVSYDEAQVERAFDGLSPLLGEGLSTAAPPERATRRQWQGLLEAPGIYCNFQGEPPLSALSVWLGGAENSENLTGSARAVLLAWDGADVWLAWRNRDGYYRAKTQVAYGGHLETVLEEYNPNGAAFAYALAGSDSAYATLDPFTLISMASPQPQSWSASTPDFVGDQEALEALLNALDFRSGVGSAYESVGELAINEGGDRLRVGLSGTVTFRAGDDVRYPVSAKGATPTAAEAALTAWDLLNRAAAPWKGEAHYVLTGVEEAAAGWMVTFQSRLAGVPVLTGGEGRCAVFTVTGRGVTEFNLSLNRYTPTGAAVLLPPQRLAAAAMGSLPDSGGELILCYPDTGSGTLTAAWMTEPE